MRLVAKWIPILCWLGMTAAIQAGNLAFPEPMASWTDAQKNGQRQAAERLAQALTEAVRKGAAEFVVPAGDYRFGGDGPRNLEIRGAANLCLQASGATFWFEPRQRLDALRLRECRKLTIRGLTIDYDPVAYSQGEITGIDPGGKSVDFRVDPGFPLPDASWTAQDGSIKSLFFDPAGQLREARMDWIASLEPRGGRDFRTTFKHGWMFVYESGVRVGDRLCLPDRSMRHAVAIENSEAVTMENLTIYASPHMALTETGGAGGHVYRGCKVVRRPGTGRLLACNADVFHSIQAKRGPRIEGCEFAHAGDDLVNIHGFFSLVVEQRGPRQVALVQPGGRSFGVGSSLEFFAWASLAPSGRARVKALTEWTGPALIESAAGIPGELARQGDRLAELRPRRGGVLVVDLEEDVAVKRWDLAGCEDFAGNGAVIRDSHFHDGFCRGILSKPSHAVIEGNRVERMGMAGILVQAERYWLEGPFAQDVSIRNNTLTDCCNMLGSRLRHESSLGAITVISVAGREFSMALHNQHLEITGNRIARPGACGIFVANTRDSGIEENEITAPCTRKPLREQVSAGLKVPGHAIFLAATENVRVRNNTVLEPGEHCRGEIGYGPGAAVSPADGQ